jgi:hypothetical protein
VHQWIIDPAENHGAGFGQELMFSFCTLYMLAYSMKNECRWTLAELKETNRKKNAGFTLRKPRSLYGSLRYSLSAPYDFLSL